MVSLCVKRHVAALSEKNVGGLDVATVDTRMSQTSA